MTCLKSEVHTDFFMVTHRTKIKFKMNIKLRSFLEWTNVKKDPRLKTERSLKLQKDLTHCKVYVGYRLFYMSCTIFILVTM